jgi:hypothetical protein
MIDAEHQQLSVRIQSEFLNMKALIYINGIL